VIARTRANDPKFFKLMARDTTVSLDESRWDQVDKMLEREGWRITLESRVTTTTKDESFAGTGTTAKLAPSPSSVILATAGQIVFPNHHPCLRDETDELFDYITPCTLIVGD